MFIFIYYFFFPLVQVVRDLSAAFVMFFVLYDFFKVLFSQWCWTCSSWSFSHYFTFHVLYVQLILPAPVHVLSFISPVILIFMSSLFFFFFFRLFFPTAIMKTANLQTCRWGKNIKYLPIYPLHFTVGGWGQGGTWHRSIQTHETLVPSLPTMLHATCHSYIFTLTQRPSDGSGFQGKLVYISSYQRYELIGS